jgi:hypothetical protein
MLGEHVELHLVNCNRRVLFREAGDVLSDTVQTVAE